MVNQLQAWFIDNSLLIPYHKGLKNVADEGAFYSTKYGTGKVQIFIHHWGPDMMDQSQHYEDLWAAADVVICCHPECLPDWVKDKHPWPDHVGPLTGQLSDTHYEVYPAS
jgi:hypothetical protein